jgi:HK97 gp10 family phage protein
MAQVGIAVKVEGLDDLIANLESFAASTSRAIVERALRTALEPMRAEAERLAPVDPAKGHLKRSLIISKNQSTGRMRRESGDKGTTVLMFMGPRIRAGAYPEAIMQEYGTKPHIIRPKGNGKRGFGRKAGLGKTAKPYLIFRLADGSWRKAAQVRHPGNPPRPFMRPAWDKHYRKCIDSLREEIGKEMMQSAKKIASKNKAK